jgi:hypothetical protein
MANTPKYLVDGLLSVSTHNGIHRLMFYELVGADSPQARPYLELAIPAPAMPSIAEAITSLAERSAHLIFLASPCPLPHGESPAGPHPGERIITRGEMRWPIIKNYLVGVARSHLQ